VTAEHEAEYVPENAKKSAEISQIQEKTVLQKQLNNAKKEEATAVELSHHTAELGKLKAKVALTETKSNLLDQETKAQTNVHMQTILQGKTPTDETESDSSQSAAPVTNSSKLPATSQKHKL
jgi:hypothetical protein